MSPSTETACVYHTLLRLFLFLMTTGKFSQPYLSQLSQMTKEKALPSSLIFCSTFSTSATNSLLKRYISKAPHEEKH